MTVFPGIDVLLHQQADLIAGRRLGLIASPSSINRDFSSSIERLRQHPAAKLVALYGPEHGVRGSAQAGAQVSTFIDPLTGLPVYSLYGDTKKPTAAMLEGIDVLVYDLQDAGVRFYTYLSTLIYLLEAGAEHNIPVIMLDRPNPISGRTPEGPMLDPDYTSFVGTAPVPIRHAMTAGELALMCSDLLDIRCDLHVVRIEGWRRRMWFDDTGLPFVQPSPNLPTLNSLTVYPGTCLVEGTNLSEGRGTTRPFEYIGAPWLNGEKLAHDLNTLKLPGVFFRPAYFTPMFSKHQGELCSGVQLHVLNREHFRAVESALHLLSCVKANHPDQFAWHPPWAEGEPRPIDLLSGGAQLREHLDAGSPVSEFIEGWQDNLKAYNHLRTAYMLYEDEPRP